MTRSTDEKQARALLDSAVAIRGVDIERATGLFAVLKDTKFEYQDVAWQNYAICLQKTRQYGAAETELKKLVKEYTANTVFRARNLRHLAEVQVAQGKITGIEQMVDEAIQIYEANRDFRGLGLMFGLKASIEAKGGKTAKALERLEEGRRMVETYSIPSTAETTARTPQPSLVGS